MRVRVVAVVGAGGLALVLSGCTVPIAGLAGVGVDENGRLVGHLAVCHDHIDGALLYDETGADAAATGTGPDRSVKGNWTAQRPVRDAATWSLAASSAGWVADRTMAPLVEGRRYSLYGWTKDSSWSTGPMTVASARSRALSTTFGAWPVATSPYAPLALLADRSGWSAQTSYATA